MSRTPLELFISYAHQDAALRRRLDEHLGLLKRQGEVHAWHDRQIGAGDDWRGQIDDRLEKADLILLLVSSSFLASDYCFDVEATRALERHALGEARVLPVIARPCDWMTAPFGEIQALPRDAKPVTSWRSRDEAWSDVARGIRAAIASARRNRTGRRQKVHLRDQRQPRYADDEARQLSNRLKTLFKRRKELTLSGSSTASIESEILDVRRLLRKGPQLRPGEFLDDGRYELIEATGQGGFATVWKAWDGERHQLVALKVLHGHYSGDRDKCERFFRGARKMAELVHPRIVRVFERECIDDDWHFFVMEYLPGGNFEQRILRNEIALDKRIEILRQVGDALEFAHGRNVVHRDVKPSNILLDENMEAKLTDFDLVRTADTTGLTATRAMMGTVQFAAPEALESAGSAGPPADVYSLGSTAVFAMCGARLPAWFYRDPARAISELDCGESLKRALQRATEFDATKRYASAAEFSRAIGESRGEQNLPVARLKVDREPASGESARSPLASFESSVPETERVYNEVARGLTAHIRDGYTLFGFAGGPNSGKTHCLKALSYLLQEGGADLTRFRSYYRHVPMPARTRILDVSLTETRRKWVFFDAGGSLYQMIQDNHWDFSGINATKLTGWLYNCKGLFFFLHLDAGHFSNWMAGAEYGAMSAERLKSLVERARDKVTELKLFGQLLLFLRALKHEDGNLLKIIAQCQGHINIEEALRRYADEAPLLDIPVMFFFSKADSYSPGFEISPRLHFDPRTLPMPAIVFAARFLPDLFVGLLSHARHFKFDFLQSYEEYETGQLDESGRKIRGAAWCTQDDQTPLSIGLMSGFEFVLRHQIGDRPWWRSVGLDTRRSLRLHKMLHPSLWRNVKINLDRRH